MCLVCVCVCVFSVCVFVCCGTLKKCGKKTRVWIQKRLRVYIPNFSVYAGTTRTCVSTCVRGADTHGNVFERTHRDVVDGHTEKREGVIASSAYQNLPT